MDDKNQYYSSINGNLYNKNKTTLIRYALGKKDTVFILPNSVRELEESVFSNCSNLERIVLHNGISALPRSAFFACVNLKELKIPDSVTEIGDSVFWCCKNLEEISLSSNIKSIGKNVFGYCNNLNIFAETGSYADEYYWFLSSSSIFVKLSHKSNTPLSI